MKIDEKIVKIVFENISDGICFYNEKSEIEYWNHTMELMTGIPLDNAVGRKCSNDILLHTDENGNPLCNTNMCPFAKAFTSNEMITDFLYIKHTSGYRFPVINSLLSIRNENEEVEGYIEIIKNKSNEFFYQGKIKDLEKLALIDPLTELPNRRFMEMEISKRILKSEREIINTGIIFMDLDNFKSFNDNYGHNTGDLLLKTVSKTMINSIRKYDIVGRWGGEEFIVIMDEINNDDLMSIALKLLNLVKNTAIDFQDKKINCTLSLGATFMKENENMEELVNRVDGLMYESKKSGKNRITFG